MRNIFHLFFLVTNLIYSQSAINNNNIHDLVDEWIANPSASQFTNTNNSPYYGHIFLIETN